MIEREPDVGYIGCTVEMPLVMGDGRTLQSCARAALSATVATVATMLEQGEEPPPPARDLKRDQQVNVRLSADEKFRLEGRARGAGYRSLSDYIRAAALRQSA